MSHGEAAAGSLGLLIAMQKYKEAEPLVRLAVAGSAADVPQSELKARQR